jgi:hypothetical protein
MPDKMSWKTYVTDTKLTDVEMCATVNSQRHLRWIGDKCYRWVQNVSGGALVLGDVVFFGTNDLTFAEAYQLGLSGKGTLGSLMGGVVTSTDGIASGSYGWIQIYGYNATINTLGHASSAIGDAMIGVSGQNYVTRSTAVGTAPVNGRHIIATVAWTTTSAAIKSGFINCLG